MSSRAVVFSGQGAQFVGMGKHLADDYPVCGEMFKRADEVLQYPLSNVCFEGPAEELTKSNHCQPAIFTSSMACYRALQEAVPDIAFAGTAGLSLGEWTALHMAGVLTFEDTLRILEARGRFMQEACEENDGAMSSIIGLSVEQLEPICRETGVTIANLNSASQTVLSGERHAIEAADAMATDAGAKRAIQLQVAGAFHSPLMESAARHLEKFLEGVEFRRAEMPVVANVTGQPHGEPDEIRKTMVAQVTSPVRWQSSIEWFRNEGVAGYVECGPGKVLTGLIRRIDPAASLYNIQDEETLLKTVETL